MTFSQFQEVIFKKKRIINGDYYFSKYAHCWGWATKRAWRCYDNKMNLE